MAINDLAAWREPLPADWRDQFAACVADLALGDAAPASAPGRLKRLASMRLPPSERLRLQRWARKAFDAPPPGFRPFRLLIAGNRTTSFFAGDIEAAGVARGLIIRTIETEYDSVRSLALSPKPLPGADALLLLLDDGFFSQAPELLDDALEADNHRRIEAELTAIIDALGARAQAPVIVATVATPPDARISSADAGIAGTASRTIDAANAAMVRAARDGRARLFDLAGLCANIGASEFFDPVRFFQAKTPFSLEASPVVADALTALIAAMTGLSGRVLVLDLDNTLWGGVVADEGLEGIVVGQGSPDGEAYLAVQRFALEMRRRGVVLAVCSKNLEAVAREPFRTHPDMLLREADFSAFVANFDDKATNIARIAERLDLNPASFVFLDDNPAERERVRAALPWVMTPEVGDDPAYFARALVASGYLEHLSLTADDVGRAATYAARAEAQSLLASVGDYETYLQSLDMELTIDAFDAIGRPRIVQLLQKSNQFNLTTRRLSDFEVTALAEDPQFACWQVRLKDRFADHGMISVLITRKDGETWSIEDWVMSCRVLERGVEAALIGELARCAAEAGAKAIVGCYRPTARNDLVRELYPRLGFEPVARGEDGAATYRLDPASACSERGAMRIVFRAQSARQPASAVSVA